MGEDKGQRARLHDTVHFKRHLPRHHEMFEHGHRLYKIEAARREKCRHRVGIAHYVNVLARKNVKDGDFGAWVLKTTIYAAAGTSADVEEHCTGLPAHGFAE